MGIIREDKLIHQDTVTNMMCDRCGKSCKIPIMSIDGKKECGTTYEYSHLQASWGYGSKKDEGTWDFYFCEKCSDLIKDFIDKGEK